MTSEHQEPSRRKHRRTSGDESEEPTKRRKHRRTSGDESEEPTKRGKHRRTSGDESEEPSKRRKHRHHGRHRHSSRRHEEYETNREEEEEETKLEDETKRDTSLHPHPLPLPESNSNWRPDYDDMEEGEIVEDEGFGADMESGEINAIEVHREFDKHNMGVHEGRDEIDPGSSLPVESNNVAKVGRYQMKLREGNGDDVVVTNAMAGRKENISDRTKIPDEANPQRNPSLDHSFNGDMVRDSSQNPRSWSPEGGGKRKSRYDDEIEIKNQSKSLSSENVGKRHKNSPSSSLHERHHNEVHNRNRSSSRDRTRERSRSRSIFQDDSLVQSLQQDARYYTDRKRSRDSDEERMSRHNRDYRHGSRDLLRDKERERSSSYRPTGRADGHHSGEIQEKDKEGSRDTWDRHREGRDRDRKSEKECERERGSTREREKERGRDRERERERDRDREREREKRESGRDINKDKESDRISRHRRHYDVDDRHGDRDRHNDLRHRRLDATDHRDRSRKNDGEKVNHSKIDHSADTEKHKREEVEQEDYQEKIVLQLAEQEEEDLNRIKEESRRRRQAILEKYKAQQLQQQRGSHLEDTVEENVKQPSQSQTAGNIDPEAFCGLTTVDADSSFSVGKSPPQNGTPVFEKASGTGGLGEGTPKSERSDDMFRDDIFGESPAGVRKSGRGDGLAIERSGLHDNWDDAEGYYSYRFGEILDARYEVIAAHGKGVFSTVVRAKDLKAGSNDPEEVAIKIIRNNDTMYKAGLEELVILKKLVGADPEDKRHCVRFLSSFKYRNHLCLVFESLHMNLREVLKKFGRNIGLKLTAVRAYAKQLFIALKHLRNCGVLHCDIKPDNMLVNDAKNVLKLCDFGNAMFAGKNEITPYLVSRFYRAPEIILGLPYDHPMDIWSVGCCLFELYTGKVLFPGPSNNDMLRLHMELKGPFPKKMLRKGAFTEQHFDQDLNFLATEEDPVTKKTIKRLILNIKPKDIGTIVLSSPGEDPKMLINFKDLLEKIFVLDPDKRITVSQALSHPFITGK
ncbi:hypothetical protein LguiB_015933 [Lonicera macranthoides]